MNETNNDLFDIFSDLYKDVNGFRPRGMTAVRFMALSQEEAEAELNELGKQLDEVMLRETEEQLMATLEFLQACRQAGSISKGIVRELEKASSDADYVDYTWGMKYGTTRHLAGILLPRRG